MTIVDGKRDYAEENCDHYGGQHENGATTIGLTFLNLAKHGSSPHEKRRVAGVRRKE
jgi:hypothetical protein